MKIVGIISEYNPFHNGHIYQIKKIKELYPNCLIIVIVSNCFTQRGDVSIINKWNKTKIMLNNDIDIVIELPFAYATQSADIFAKGALSILNELKIDTLVFGTESDDIEKLIELANIQLNNNDYDNLVKRYLDEGINYPTALSKALEDMTNYKIKNPNDLLGLSYVKEIIKNNYLITPISIKRTNEYHGNIIKDNIINATLIRELLINNEDISNYLPKEELEYLNKDLSINSFYPYLKYQIISNIDELNKFQTVDEGIENRIKKYINTSDSWEELVNNIKTKRWTYNKINRMLLHILTSFTKEEAKNIDIDYIRLLGFNDNGKKYLNKIKKSTNLPIITNYKKSTSKLLDIDYRALCIYDLIVDSNLDILEYKSKPIIK